MKRIFYLLLLLGACSVLSGVSWDQRAYAAQASGSTGIQAQISSPPPSQGATISVPRDGQVFTQLPITVSGICPKGLLVKIFKNNVFAGSAQCADGSFSITIDLFNGRNELVVRVYDALDQAGPDSNTVTVTFNDGARAGAGARPTLTSNYAKRGANPGQELTWPIILSGGAGPYAVSVDWGDGKAPDLISLGFPGPFDIKHIYDSAGIYNIIVKVTDREGLSAYLQLVGIANGTVGQSQAGDGDVVTPPARGLRLWQALAINLPFLVCSFWLGGRYRIHLLRQKLERGERPF